MASSGVKSSKKKSNTSKMYGPRYGSRIRKRVDSANRLQKGKYICEACGKTAVRRVCVGIWSCRRCGNKFAGGAYSPATINSVSDVIKTKK